MPAATPQPSLEDLLIILSRCSGLRINMLDMLDIHGNVAELCFKFDRRNLGPSADWVFKSPSSIFPALKDFLEFDETLEKAYRDGDPRNTIDDVIAFMEQLVVSYPGSGLEGKMKAAFFSSTLKYLRELARRRRDADRRVREAEEARRKNTEEEVKRKVEEEIHRREEERQRAKAEAHARWEREWQEKADDGSSNRQRYSNPFEQMFREAGIDINDPNFRRAYSSFYGFDFGRGRRPYENPFEGKNPSPPPPPPGAKRKWFEVLGCSPGASRDEIRRAAREAAKGLHPDKSHDPKAKEKFQEISEAKAEGLAGCV